MMDYIESYERTQKVDEEYKGDKLDVMLDRFCDECGSEELEGQPVSKTDPSDHITVCLECGNTQ